MDVRLPNGQIIRGVPEGTPKDAIKTKAVQAGLAQAADFLSPQQVSGEIPVMESEMGMLPQVYEPQVKPAPERTLGETLTGLKETGQTLLTGAVTAPVFQTVGTVQGIIDAARAGTFGTYEGAEQIAQQAQSFAQTGTYAPKTEAGQAYVGAVGETMQPLAHLAGVMPGSGGLAATSRAAVPTVVQQGGRAGKLVAQAGKEASDLIKQSLARRRRSRYYQPTETGVGAEETAQATRRIATAESLPVPVKLTKGAAVRNADELAFEKEQMKMQMGGPLRDRVEENNLQILQNFDEFVDRTGAEQLHTSKSATGRSVVKPLAKGLEHAKVKVNRAYNKANNSPESRIPVSPKSLQDYVNNQITGSESVQVVDALRKFVSKRKNNMGRLNEDGDIELGHFTETGEFVPSLTVGKMEQLRQFINTHKMANPTDEAHTVIMKGLIDEPTLPVAGPLYTKARRLRQRQGELFENRAVVARLLNTKKGGKDPEVALDEVFNKTILGSSPEEVVFLRRVLKNSGDEGKQAWRELQGATIDHIRERATSGMGMDSNDMPIVSPAKLNQVIKQLDNDGRLEVIFGPRQTQVIRDLNDVVRYINTVPPGTLINNSGTAATLLLAIGEMGGTGLATGLPVPVLTTLRMFRAYTKDRAIKKKIQNALNYHEKVMGGGEGSPDVPAINQF